MRAVSLLALATLAAAPALTGATPAPEEAEFLDAFQGDWRGSGIVRRNAESGPQKVRCSLSGTRSEDGLTFSGTCRAYLVFSRRISADIRYDAESDSYAGSYSGSLAGTAALSGRRKGNSVVLDVRWPKPVNGDTSASMEIVGDGDSFRILVTDEISGEPTPVTDLAFARSG